MKFKEKISDCEEKVLMAIYDRGDDLPDLAATRAVVNKKFNHTWAPQTVSTFLLRLVKKGCLNSSKKGRYTYYTPTLTLDEYRVECLKDMKERLFDGSLKLLQQYVDQIE